MSRSPAVILYDANGVPLPIGQGATIGSTPRVLVAGSDYSGTPKAYSPKIDDAGLVHFSLDALSRQLKDGPLGGDRALGGSAISSERVQQLIAKFDQSLASNAVNVTTSGGATVVQGSGLVTMTSGTATTATARVETSSVIRYSPGREMYMGGTFSCSAAPTHANTKVRFGMFDANDGLWFGYDGSTFVIATRKSATDTTVARASWNGDPLDGTATSKFTRAGTPEAIDFTKQNLFRIRWLYYGSGPIVFEVLSPDDDWIVFHTIRRPNSAATLTIASTRLPIRSEIVKASADAQSIVVAHGSWDAGTAEHGEAFGIEDIRGRVYKEAALAASADSTVYTVTTGRVLRITNMVISVDNTSAITSGRLDVKDGGAGGTLKESIRINTSFSSVYAVHYPVPKRYSTDVFADVIAGSLNFAISFTGFETDN